MTDSRTRIKDRFKSGTIPSERDFAALIDLMVPTDVFESAIAGLQTAKKDAAESPNDERNREIAILRREKAELEARIDQDIANLREERGAIEPLLRRPDLQHRREIEAASDYLEREISALRDERQGIRLRQDQEIAALRRSPAEPLPPASTPPRPKPPEPAKRQVRADGTWQTLQVDHPVGAFAITASMTGGANASTTFATVVVAGPLVKPKIIQRKCYDHGLWILLVPAGVLASSLGAFFIWMHGLLVWKEPWSAAGLWLALVGLAASVVGFGLNRRRALTISWRRTAGLFALKGPGAFRLRSTVRFLDGDAVSPIVYSVTPFDG